MLKISEPVKCERDPLTVEEIQELVTLKETYEQRVAEIFKMDKLAVDIVLNSK